MATIMKFLSYDILSLLSSSCDEQDASSSNSSNNNNTVKTTSSTIDSCCCDVVNVMMNKNHSDIHSIIKPTVSHDATKENQAKVRNSGMAGTPPPTTTLSRQQQHLQLPSAIVDEDSFIFQIKSTIASWSVCWNRGDAVGYCNSYYNNSNVRYTSIDTNGSMTTIYGYNAITEYYTKIFRKYEQLYQKRQQQQEMYAPNTTTTSSSTLTGSCSYSSIAGYLTYHDLHVDLIPSISSSPASSSTTENDFTKEKEKEHHHHCRHAIVYGQYTLCYGNNNKGTTTSTTNRQRQQQNKVYLRCT